MENKKQSKIKQEYRRVRRNLLRKINRATKRGYIIDNIVPAIPKKPTEASIRRLEKISANLYEKVKAIDFETGEIIRGTERRKQERKEAAAKAQETRRALRYNAEKQITEEFEYSDYSTFPNEEDMVIANFRSLVISRFPESAGPVLTRWLNNIIVQQGKIAVAQMLQDAQDNGIIIDYKVAYDNDSLMGAIADMMDFLPEIGDISKQELLDSLEMEEDWELPN